MLERRIIKSLVRTVDIGLHSGRGVTLTLHPVAAGTGIVLTHIDLDSAVEIPVTVGAIGNTRLAPMLQKDGARISIAEHLMPTCAGLDIDNLYVDVDTEKIPIMDGNTASFVFLLQSVGIEEQGAVKRFTRVTKPVEIREGDKLARLDPHFGFKLPFTIEFRHLAVGKTGQTFEADFTGMGYTHEIARARTFGFAHEVEVPREVGLARGDSLDSVIVLDERRMLNNDKLCYGDKFVRHRIPDAIGDPYVMSHPLIAAYTAHKPGHSLNNVLLYALLVDETAYEMVTFDKVEKTPRVFPPQWQPAFS